MAGCAFPPEYPSRPEPLPLGSEWCPLDGWIGFLVLGCMPEYVGGLTMSNSSAFFVVFVVGWLFFCLFFQ